MVTRRFPATVSPAGGAASLQSFAATVRALLNSGLSLEVDADTDNVLQKHGELTLPSHCRGKTKPTISPSLFLRETLKPTR